MASGDGSGRGDSGGAAGSAAAGAGTAGAEGDAAGARGAASTGEEEPGRDGTVGKDGFSVITRTPCQAIDSVSMSPDGMTILATLAFPSPPWRFSLLFATTVADL
jgi:hypothetical protein